MSIDTVNINSDASVYKTDQVDINSDAVIWKQDTVSITSQAVIIGLPNVRKVEPRLKQIYPTPYQNDSGFKIF